MDQSSRTARYMHNTRNTPTQFTWPPPRRLFCFVSFEKRLSPMNLILRYLVAKRRSFSICFRSTACALRPSNKRSFSVRTVSGRPGRWSSLSMSRMRFFVLLAGTSPSAECPPLLLPPRPPRPPRPPLPLPLPLPLPPSPCCCCCCSSIYLFFLWLFVGVFCWRTRTCVSMYLCMSQYNTTSCWQRHGFSVLAPTPAKKAIVLLSFLLLLSHRVIGFVLSLLAFGSFCFLFVFQHHAHPASLSSGLS